MKRSLLIAISVSAVGMLAYLPGQAQIKGNPKMDGTVQQLTFSKTPTKLSAALTDLHTSKVPNLQNKAKPVTAPSDALQNLMQVKGEKVLVDFTAKGDVAAAKAELIKLGVEITGVYDRVISGFVPITVLPKLESAATIRFAKPAYKPRHQSVKGNAFSRSGMGLPSPGDSKITPVFSQGDTAMLSYIARKKYHVDGDGVKVGILSDSYNNLGTADIGVKHGELPGKGNPFGYKKPVQVLEDYAGGETDEGRAMMEIVHDVAPGAGLAFHTAYNGEANFAQGIQDLTNKGCQVIADDIGYFDEPYFQDGIIAQSVDIAKKRGVTYFSAAGNQGVSSYESDYRPTDFEILGPGNGTAHNFSGKGDLPRYAQPLYVPSGGSIIVGFQWDQSSFAASGVGPTSDYDIYLADIYGNVVAASYDDNLYTGEPSEILGYQNNTFNYTFFLIIVKYSGPDAHRLKYLMYNSAQFYLTDPAIPGILAPTLVGHAKAEGAIATGAAWYLNTPAYGLDTPYVEYFSSVGGVANYFDIRGNRIPPLVRKKPTIVAPDGVNTSFFDPFGNGDIPQDADTFPNFFGTSAAAPHGAGVAALMIDAQKLNTITPDQIKGELSATALDMDDIYTDGFDKGYDFNTGYGFVNAEKAVGKVKFPNLYIKNLDLKPLCTDDPASKRNWVIINPNPFAVEVTWFVKGSGQTGCLTVQPGETVFTTKTVISRGCPTPNIAVLSWKDNFGFPRFDLAFSTSARCGRERVSPDNSDERIAGKADVATDDAAEINNLAEVFPNPSATTFRLYLSLDKPQPANIELYSIEGKKLQAKTISQNKGVFDIDASGYAAGIYLLHIKQGNFSKTIRLIKQ